MSTRITKNVSLTPEFAEFVEGCVASGRFQSDSEVVRQGLRLLQEHEAGLDFIRAKIKIGLKQIEQGEVVDGKEAFAELRRRSAARRKRA